MNDEVPAFGSADLTNCDREPIHIPGSIQPHGALLALDLDRLTVVQAGGDTGRLIGVAADQLIGRPIEDWLSPAQVARLRELLATGAPMLRPVHAFRAPIAGGNGDADVTAHLSDGFLILEFEPIWEESHEDSLALVQKMVRSIQQAELGRIVLPNGRRSRPRRLKIRSRHGLPLFARWQRRGRRGSKTRQGWIRSSGCIIPLQISRNRRASFTCAIGYV